MNNVGKLIERRRRQLGLSREDVAARLGVTPQTVLNLERDRNYNLGTRMLQRLEVALGIEIHISFKEARTMDNRLRIGNDELILHIRKNFECPLTNDQLGKRIWIWLRDNASGEKIEEDRPCIWGSDSTFVSALLLPKTAAQFEFNLDALPDLFRFLQLLAQEQKDATEDN